MATRIAEDNIKKILLKLYRQKSFRNAAIRFTRMPRGKTWVFIVGCYNSGTTLLDYILGLHEEISTLPTEGVALSDQLSNPEDFGWPRIWHKCIEKIYLDETDNVIDVDRIKKEWALWFNRRKAIFVEKSVSNSARIKWINRNFEHPYFLWIIRNGYCVAEGIRRRAIENKRYLPPYYPKSYPIELCAEQWVVNNEIIKEDTRGLNRVMRVSYEDLTENLHKTVSNILQWLPVCNKLVPSVNTFFFQGKARPIENMNEESISNLSVGDITSINEVAVEYLQKWGYNIL